MLFYGGPHQEELVLTVEHGQPVSAGNSASGGAFVIVAASSTIRIQSSTFSNNTGASYGGAVSLSGGDLSVQDSEYVHCVICSRISTGMQILCTETGAMEQVPGEYGCHLGWSYCPQRQFHIINIA